MNEQELRAFLDEAERALRLGVPAKRVRAKIRRDTKLGGIDELRGAVHIARADTQEAAEQDQMLQEAQRALQLGIDPEQVNRRVKELSANELDLASLREAVESRMSPTERALGISRDEAAELSGQALAGGAAVGTAAAGGVLGGLLGGALRGAPAAAKAGKIAGAAAKGAGVDIGVEAVADQLGLPGPAATFLKVIQELRR